MQQLSLLIGEARKDEGMERAYAAANPDFKTAAREAVIYLAKTRPYLTTDDVWDAIEGIADTREHRALGAVMRQAAKEAVIVKTDRVVATVRPCANRRPISVWRSLLAETGVATSASAG